MWEIIQLSHHDKLSDTTSTQLQHSFHTSFNNLWNNSSTHFHHILHHILHQQTIQDLVTNLSFTIYDAILYHKISSNLSSQFHHNIFITYFITFSSHTSSHTSSTNFRTTLSRQLYSNVENNSSFITFIHYIRSTIYDTILYHKISSNEWVQIISHLITTSFNKSHELFLRNHLTKFKAIDFISHTYHNLITTLSHPYHNLIASLSQPYHNNFKNTFQQTLHNFISTNSSQLHFNKLFNKLSDILFITNIQRIFLRNDLANYSSQTFQQTMIHFYITNIHNRRVGYRSFIASSSHLHHD